jgi:hypothetical protein
VTLDACCLTTGLKTRGKLAADPELCSGRVQLSLGEEELMVRVGIGIEANLDFRLFYRIVLAITKRLAQGPQEVEGSLIACRITGIANDGECASAGSFGINGHEITHPDTMAPGEIAANNIVNVASVDIRSRVAFIRVCDIGKGGLRDVVAGKRIAWPLQHWPAMLVQEIADNFFVSPVQVMRI